MTPEQLAMWLDQSWEESAERARLRAQGRPLPLPYHPETHCDRHPDEPGV